MGLFDNLKRSLFKNFTAQEKRDIADAVSGKTSTETNSTKTQRVFGSLVKLVRNLMKSGNEVSEADIVEMMKPKETFPGGISKTTSRGTFRKIISLFTDDGGRKRFPTDHPIVTGQPVKAQSSNVYAYWYDYDKRRLYIQFWETNNKSQSPGPTYWYESVTTEQFISLYKADSKGTWIWDNIRVRGTVSSHRGLTYKLAAVGASGYVPRKAEFTNGSSGKGEYFIKRRVNVRGTNVWLSSQRPDALVSAYERKPNRAEPNRGEPNRGEPNRG
jgi:hypothetical protein